MISDGRDFDNIQPARLLVRLLKIFGLWTYEEKSWNSIYRLYSWLLHSFFTFLFVLGMYINTAFAESMNDLSDALYILFTETALVLKVLNAKTKYKTIVKFIEIFEKNPDGLPCTHDELNIARKEQSSFNRLRNPYIGGSVVAVISSIIAPQLNKSSSYTLPFPCWFPFDHRNPQNYPYAYAYVSIGVIVTATSNYTLDSIQAYILQQLSIYNKILAERFKNFGHTNNEDEKLLHKYFHFHSYVKSLTTEFEAFISITVMVQISLSALVICFTVYQLQNIHIIENPGACLTLIVYVSVMSLQIFMPCFFGNELTASFDDLSYAVYSSNWTSLPAGMRKEMFIFMEILKRPVVIHAGKIFNISLNIFLQVMNNTYRIYAVLLNLDN